VHQAAIFVESRHHSGDPGAEQDPAVELHQHAFVDFVTALTQLFDEIGVFARVEHLQGRSGLPQPREGDIRAAGRALAVVKQVVAAHVRCGSRLTGLSAGTRG
jgi:hypothetical protein